MALVLDASVTASWAFIDENHPVAAKSFAHAHEEPIFVPNIWWFEIRNTLIVNERRGRISEIESSEFLRGLASLDIVIDDEPEETALLALCRRHRLTVYDGAYLELAVRKRTTLATFDTALMRAATAEHVPLVT